MGIDPGKYCAWTVADLARPGDAAAAVACGTLDRGVAEGKDLRVEEAIDIMVRYKPDVVLVETVEFVVGREGLGPHMAGHLVRAARLGGRIFQAALDHGFPAEEVTAEMWRRWMVGNPQADNKRIAQGVRMRVANWPAKSSNHENDSAGLAAFGLERALRRSLGLLL